MHACKHTHTHILFTCYYRISITVTWPMKRASSYSVIFCSSWLVIVACCACCSFGALFSFLTRKHTHTHTHARARTRFMTSHYSNTNLVIQNLQTKKPNLRVKWCTQSQCSAGWCPVNFVAEEKCKDFSSTARSKKIARNWRGKLMPGDDWFGSKPAFSYYFLFFFAARRK